ncbi:type IV secretory system conjugative DNA transfer family protein [Nocardia sp. NEAU-351]|uniref:Type IV secretory system conjugative DNA transfer family protein n=2 Tax=Nocardia bovistercoris TaxID=2785916 RepID=A0A931IH92_9NOCA|nr:type IV secretory system conjugative DNA transfer family protein [Nocardia bovistercoris]
MDFDESWRFPILTAAGFGVGEGVGASIRIGEALYGGPDQDVSVNPLTMAINLATGDLHWTGAATGGAVTLVLGSAVTVVGSVWAWKAACRKCSELYRDRGRIKREAIDSQAKFLAKGKDLASLTRAAVAAKAAALKVQLGEGDAPGVLIALSVADGQALYGSYEDLHLDIWGPRTGKSTSRVIPAVMEAVGAVVATSNKRDVVDATRVLRSTEGRRAWVFDPQGVAAEPCSWYWDPADWVLGEDGGDGAEERAAELAAHFSAGNESTARDAFFEPEGESLLTGLILAAAVAKKPITQVFRWVTKSSDDAPVDILQNAGYVLAAASLRDQYGAPDKQRGGVFSTAKKMAACLRFSAIQRWVCPPTQGEPPRTAFKVADFVRSRDTLYPLSEEGPASAGPLVTALCAAVAGAGKAEGVRHGGRVPVPLTIVLDEAANIVRWRDLPKQYSHFGSRGLVVMTILQSWAQGERCWGVDGMRMLWSAANIKVIGGGLDDEAFLRARSELIGPHYELTTSVSRSKDSRSSSTSRTSEITLHPSDLAALPRGRCVVFTSGNRPTLGQTVPWMDRPYAAQIAAELAKVAESHQYATGRPALRIVSSTGQEGRTA